MSPRRRRVVTLVLMGVAGSGKSSVMTALAEQLPWPWIEGDDLHPAANVAKMAAGIPLTDEDRGPWLRRISGWIGEREAERQSAIATCSALRRTYRDVLRRGNPSVWFVHLVAPPDVLLDRMGTRVGHFMPAALLESQLATLEPLEPDEPGTAMDATAPAREIANRVVEMFRFDRR